MGKRIELDNVFRPILSKPAYKEAQKVLNEVAAARVEAIAAKFDKTAYQREYMKRWRAKQKAKK